MDETCSKIQSEDDDQVRKQQEESCETITLRPMELSDVDDFMVWVTDDRVSKYCLWDTYTSKDQAIDFIKNRAIPHPWLKAICTNNRAIGTISVTPNSGNDKCRAELGYVLAHSFWGKGIMTKAVEMVISTIFEEWPYLERVEALVDVDNIGSQRVLEKAGFQREGVLRKYIFSKGSCRDLVMFSFLSSDR
ncbi:OLC1v1035496C1 [Oldenlandia corymbosa var. corymbosa]|uniref:OLC1v1035496C1 n=1 Tax=Oldenlandia corymbosa var. corymbosa TaxID=529605 RepID=A0AAV1CT42_OLDCO|nr:OLC1v1035496C1 [Oldenlandia corymbosa var. corymbosa]